MKSNVRDVMGQLDDVVDTPAFQAEQSRLLGKLASLSDRQHSLKKRLDELNLEKEELDRLAH